MRVNDFPPSRGGSGRHNRRFILQTHIEFEIAAAESPIWGVGINAIEKSWLRQVEINKLTAVVTEFGEIARTGFGARSSPSMQSGRWRNWQWGLG
jgi:hypothetical protein